MRFLVIILVFINIGVWTYFNQDLFYNASSSTGNEEIDPDKMHLLTPHQLSTLPKVVKTKPDVTKEAPAVPVAAATKAKTSNQCYVWNNLNDSNINKARSVVKKLALKPTTKTHGTSGKKRYWVHLPPLKNAAEAKKKAAELKARGITELFVLQGNKSRNAISFGVFGDEMLADKLLKNLNSQGINAVKKVRSEGNASYSLHIKKVSSQKFAKLSAQQAAYPKTNLKTVRCL